MNDIIKFDSVKELTDFALLAAKGTATIPKHLQNSPADCMAVAVQSQQWGMSFWAVAQQSFFVNGSIGYSAQLVNAIVSSSKAIQGRFKYEYNWENGKPNGFVRCGAIIAGEDGITWGEWLDTSKVTTRNSPLWKTAPKQQAAYLAVKYWARLYTPEVIMGVYSHDELVDTKTPKDVTPKVETEAPENPPQEIEFNIDAALDTISQCSADQIDALAEELRRSPREHHKAIAEKLKIRRQELVMDAVVESEGSNDEE